MLGWVPHLHRGVVQAVQPGAHRRVSGAADEVICSPSWPHQVLFFQLSDPPVTGVELVLQANDGLVTFVQPLREGDHDVALLQEELLVAAHLSLVLLDRRALSLQLEELCCILRADPLLLCHCMLEVQGILGLLTAADKQLGRHLADADLELLLLRLLLLEDHAPLLQGRHGRLAVLLRAPATLLELQQLAPADDVALAPLAELRTQPPELRLVAPEQRPLVHVLIDLRAVADGLGAVRELERGERLRKGLGRRRDHGHHRRPAVAPEGVLQEARELGVAVGHVLPWPALRERGDDVAQRREALVDLLRLLQALACGAREPGPLGAGEVHERQLRGGEA
mmetsp:Transcript_75187/g.233246  ORF Transcript_75187/g.233246 Transcript_75187/m.233246 type:complete len:339 (-) Transcript_75187:10-1026(-)